MKKFFLYYTTITGGEYTLHFTEVFAFMDAMEKAMDNRFVNPGSYKIWTEEGK